MRVEQWPIGDVKPYPGNPRNNDDAVEAVARSLDEFGWQQPIVVDADGTVIVGHTRLKAAKRLGMETVPVVVAKELTPAQVNAYRLADNKVGELATWDMDLLFAELDGLQADFDMSSFGFDMEIPEDWFESRERNDDSREEGNDEYNAFLDKFEAKKTTDDCYTPDLVYDAVADWVADEYGLDRSAFVRPFYPGGDYENEEYPDGCVVVDNPPFSILAEILRFYVAHGVRFFLFAPTLTLFSGRGCDICYLPVGVGVTYENGASVNTSFITNMEPGLRIRTAPTLYSALKEANDANQREVKGELPNYEYPPEVVTAAGLSRYSVHGVELKIGSGECQRISALDAMKASGKAIFGGGFLLGDDAEERNAEAARKKDENVRNAEMERLRNAVENPSVQVGDGGVVIWRLSDREREIAASLG